MWQLLINGPGYFDTAYQLVEGVTQVGRADENDVVLSGDLVSRRHCRLHVSAEKVVFEDLGSRNGTQLNHERVEGTHELKPGDVISIGENSLALRQVAHNGEGDTEMIDARGSRVKHFGRGAALDEAMMVARELTDSGVLRALDNVESFEFGAPPVPNTPMPSDSAEREKERVAVQSLVLLYRVAEALSRAPSLQSFLEQTCDLVMRRVRATTAVVLLRHRSGVLTPAAVRHEQKLTTGEVPVSDAIIDAALKKGQAIAVTDVQGDRRFSTRESVVLYGADQVLCIPIGSKSPFAGVLYLNRAGNAPGAAEELLDLCTATAQLLGTGVEKFQGRPELTDRLRSGLERLYAPEVAVRQLESLRGTEPPSVLLDAVGTVLVAELVGLRDLAPQLAPARLTDLLAEWHRVSSQLVMSFEGVVDRLGAGQLRAVFGAPAVRGGDAIRAVRAGVALRAEWEQLSSKRPEAERLQVRAGVTTGRIVSGVVSTEVRVDPVLVGEPADVAAVVCASAEPGQVLITGKALAHVGARFDVTPLGERPLPGFKGRMAVFEVLDEDSDASTLSGLR